MDLIKKMYMKMRKEDKGYTDHLAVQTVQDLRISSHTTTVPGPIQTAQLATHSSYLLSMYTVTSM